MEVRVREDAAEAAREGGEVASGDVGDCDAGREDAWGVEEGGCAVEGVDGVVDCAALLIGEREDALGGGFIEVNERLKHTSMAPSFPCATQR